jgi:hypothetical protein
MMKGWENSPGACLEREKALEWGMQVLYDAGDGGIA